MSDVVSARKKRDDAIALDISIGGEPERPYSESRDLQRGKGDVTNWPAVARAKTEEGHQADADAAVKAADSSDRERRGPRKNFPPKP